MRTAIFVVCLLVLIVFGLLALLSFALLRYVVKPKKETLEETKALEVSRGFWGEYDTYKKRELNIPSEQGYLLHGILLENDPERFVIVSHGYTANRWASVKYANLYYELGYSVYIYDLRHHGQNASCYCSMGKWESRDIVTITRYLRDTYGERCSIGLHGESLGAASSILALGEENGYCFCVADCGFADLGQLLEDLSGKILHLPAKASHLASYACKIRYGYRLDQVRPVDALKKNHTTPLLLLHGKEDDFILPKHCKILYDAANNKKELHYFEHAAHASSYASNPKKYQEIVKEFVQSI